MPRTHHRRSRSPERLISLMPHRFRLVIQNGAEPRTRVFSASQATGQPRLKAHLQKEADATPDRDEVLIRIESLQPASFWRRLLHLLHIPG